MSRSYHQRHKKSRRHKEPNVILDAYYDGNNKRQFIERKPKTKPYGRKDFIGYGEEEYSSKYGEYTAPKINKKAERRKAKQLIYKNLEEE